MVLLDVMMPDGTGWDFCRELRLKTSAPVIFLTCRNENESVVKGLLQGGDDYVTKPYDLYVLAQASPHSCAGRIELPPLVIDMLEGSVTLEGRAIRLTQKELQLLACLAVSAGRRLSVAELFRRAWGSDTPNAKQSVAVHITNLRKKLCLDDSSGFELRSTLEGEYIFSRVRYVPFAEQVR